MKFFVKFDEPIAEDCWMAPQNEYADYFSTLFGFRIELPTLPEETDYISFPEVECRRILKELKECDPIFVQNMHKFPAKDFNYIKDSLYGQEDSRKRVIHIPPCKWNLFEDRFVEKAIRWSKDRNLEISAITYLLYKGIWNIYETEFVAGSDTIILVIRPEIKVIGSFENGFFPTFAIREENVQTEMTYSYDAN